MNKKFKLTKEKKEVYGITLYRIEALISFGNVSKGEKGGWVEKEDNLSQSGNAWVYGYAEVSGDARVSGDAEVSGNAWVFGNARVYGYAEVSGNARVYGYARVYGNAWVYGTAWVYGNARVYGNAEVYGELKLEFGWCFGRKREDWDVTEMKNKDEILLIKDYKPAEEEKVEELTMEEVCKELGREVKIKK